MAFSTNITTDLGTCITAGPSATTATNAQLAAGPIQDYAGNLAVAKVKAQELLLLLTAIIASTDAGDANLANLKKCANACDGGAR
jgi:hypothetical protein